MSFVQSIKLVPREVIQHATLSLALLMGLAACADGVEQAAEAGAVAQQQLQSGNLPAARQSINDAIAARDDVVELHLLRGQIELAAGSLSAAYDAYSDALALDPTNGTALQGVSQLGIRTGHAFESLQATERILTLEPNQPDALLMRGIHALVRRRNDEAIEYADRVLAAAPGHAEASVLKARALFMKGEVNEALTTVARAEAVERPNPSVALTKLEIFRELREAAEMAEQFAVLRQIQPDDRMMRVDEANLWFKLGKRMKAHELVAGVLAEPKLTSEEGEAALKLWEEYGAEDVAAPRLSQIASRGSEIARVHIARFLIEQRMFVQARKIISSLRAGERESLLARLHSNDGSYDAALTSASRVLGLDETQCDALIAHSQANVGMRRPSEALVSGQRAAAECPEYTAAWLVAADAYRALKRASGVERVYTQAADTHPQSLTITKTYAEWLLRDERTREAVAIARRLTRAAPALLSGWRYYGDVCRRAKSGCEDEAARGLANAKTMYGIDLEPGAAAPNGLVGRLVRR